VRCGAHEQQVDELLLEEDDTFEIARPEPTIAALEEALEHAGAGLR
jgi:hypothetical protein